MVETQAELERTIIAQEVVFDMLTNALDPADIEIEDETERELAELFEVDVMLGRLG